MERKESIAGWPSAKLALWAVPRTRRQNTERKRANHMQSMQ